jgi:hypothetical protein
VVSGQFDGRLGGGGGGGLGFDTFFGGGIGAFDPISNP